MAIMHDYNKVSLDSLDNVFLSVYLRAETKTSHEHKVEMSHLATLA